MMKKTALIMAGGRGERFWPKSRKSFPKQFLSLTDDEKTMIQLTVERINEIVSIEDIFIVTNEDYKKLIIEQFPDLPEENILCEPAGRNTAPCIALGAAYIAKKYADAIMFVLPSDHLIKNQELYWQTMKEAAKKAEEGNNLVTIGIRPNYPETGYGYIRFDNEIGNDGIYPVECFVEKPDLETAKEYLNTGKYLWNSGMFVWKVSSILHNVNRFLPDMNEGLEKISQAIGTENESDVLKEEFIKFRAESIDYGVMEKADNIFVMYGDFGWDDVGSWLAVDRIKKKDNYGNVIKGNVIAEQCKRSVLEGKDKLIAAIGLEDIIIVDTDDITLVCNKNHTNSIKNVLEHLRQTDRNEYI